jgi:hypothetical protein
MVSLTIAAVITLVSLVTSHFLPDRFRGRKIVLLVIGIVGAAWSFAQGYWSLERVVDLQQKIAARALSPGAQDRIASKLKMFKGTPFDLSLTPAGETEFLNEVMHALSKSGWEHRAFGGFGMSADELKVHDDLPHAGVLGSLVGVRPLYDLSNETLRAPAEALAAALTAEGIAAANAEAKAGLASGSFPMRIDTIHVQIGNRL